VNEANDPLQHFDVRILVDAQVVRADASLSSHGGRFSDNQRRTSDGS
jgi:hypothetical protein